MHTAAMHMIPSKSLIILISSLEDDPLVPNAVEELIAQGHHIMVVSPSPAHIEYLLSQQDTTQQLAFHVFTLERKNTLQILRQRGAQVVDWKPDESLSIALKEVERFQVRR